MPKPERKHFSAQVQAVDGALARAFRRFCGIGRVRSHVYPVEVAQVLEHGADGGGTQRFTPGIGFDQTRPERSGLLKGLKAVLTGEQLIYQSNNGDTWFLTQDPTTGAQAVRHVPNPQLGGQLSYIELEQFLSEGANGPEHQALRRLVETSARSATLLIA
jgi:hypothetical protein